MALANERIVVQVTHSQKEHITSTAKRLGLKVSELMRQAAQHYEPAANEVEFDRLLAQIQTSTQEAERALASTFTFVAQSNQRIERLLQETSS